MIHILYRHTNTISSVKNRPHWFNHDVSLNNILNTIENDNRVQFHLMFDGKTTINHNRIDELVEFDAGSDWESFKFTWNYADMLELEDSDLVYFLENDYLHTNGWVDSVINLYKKYDIDGYVSLYDHLDKYTLPMYSDLSSHLIVTEDRHWRTTPSTCGSFIINKKTLKADMDVHTTTYGDHDKFIKLGIERNRVILTPIPSLSTHCEVDYLSPIIDWEYISSK